MTKLIVGCGYLGSRVARLWRDAGHEVFAMTRAPARAKQWGELGLRPIVGDVTCALKLDTLPAADTVLYAVGFDRGAGHDQREVYVDGLRNVLDALPRSVGRFIYISSTSVYGQNDGSWVDEASPCEPAGANGQVCLDAERLLQSHSLGKRATVLRLAGIYGPGRIPRASALRAGEPIPAPPEGWLNLIHVDDAAAVVLAAEAAAQPAALYTVSDGAPVPRRDYYAELSRLLEAPPPRYDSTGGTPSRRAPTDKRVGNARMLADLRVSLVYPSYREGLAAIVPQEPRV